MRVSSIEERVKEESENKEYPLAIKTILCIWIVNCLKKSCYQTCVYYLQSHICNIT